MGEVIYALSYILRTPKQLILMMTILTIIILIVIKALSSFRINLITNGLTISVITLGGIIAAFLEDLVNRLAFMKILFQSLVFAIGTSSLVVLILVIGLIIFLLKFRGSMDIIKRNKVSMMVAALSLIIYLVMFSNLNVLFI